MTTSDDSSVKLWRPHSSQHSQPITLGAHLDFANRLASPGDASNWVASGGLDRRVVIWDLESGRDALRFKVHEDDATSRMVWSMAASNSMVATGSNDHIVRLHDPRSAKRIHDLVGHTDIVRALLISQDEQLVMSCSSDKTIKLWSAKAGRCISTLNLHDASVWALYSDHPSLSCFYSGDRQGRVIKTDCRGFSGGGIEQAVSYALLKESSPITRLCAANGRVWTATEGHDVNVWKDLDVIPGDLAVETTASPRSGAGARNRGVSISVSGPSGETTQIPSTCVVRMGNLQGALTSGGRNRSRLSTHQSVTTRRGGGSSDSDGRNPTPLRPHPERTVHGHAGLMKAIMLNDKRRVIAVDNKNRVHLWDILECRYLRALGNHPLDKTLTALNTLDVVPNWCSIATDIGVLVCTIDEKKALDAEIYADQIEQSKDRGISADVRINLGAWMLRSLFNGFVLEERSRDARFREQLHEHGTLSPQMGNMSINIPPATLDTPVRGGATPKPQKPAVNTPGVFAIGTATPFVSNSPANAAKMEENEPPHHTATDGSLDDSTNNSSQPGDYFSAKAVEEGVDTSSTASQADGSEASRNSSSKEPPSATLSQRFKTAFSTRRPKTGEASLGPAKTSQSEERSDEAEMPAETPDTEDPNSQKLLMHVLEEIRDEYISGAKGAETSSPESLLKPTLPEETLTLNISPHTTILIQEHDHCTEKSLAVCDVFQGQQGDLGESTAMIEQAAPYWLGALLFKVRSRHLNLSQANKLTVVMQNERPAKEQVKVPFLLKAYDDTLPQVTLHEG